ncbi:MAG: cell division protein ZapA [Ruminococcaceae bacterium]|nr:cell division protein ZapA [Oscillospiraceae bacterium]
MLKNTLIVQINGQDYTLASEESREYMLGIADAVDQTMKEINQLRPDLNTAMLAVLTALNIAEKSGALQRENESLKQQLSASNERVRRLEAELQRGRR